MSELSRKINFPQTSMVKNEDTRRYVRKLTRVLDDLMKYIEQNVNNITNIISEQDHGNLLGLQDIEDHLYAFLVDGSRAFTDHGSGFSNDPLLADEDPYSAVSEYAIKAYVDALLAYILASPVGSIIYIWEDWDGEKYLERLIPGEYGQVLTTGGPNQKPFWSWVWQEPGADWGGKIYYRVWMYAYPIEASIITMDVTKTVSAGGLTSILRDSESDPTYFTAYYPELKASVLNASIITMDAAKQVGISMISSYKMTPLFINVYDSVSVTDEVTAVLTPLKVDLFDSLSVTDYAEVSMS